MNADLSIRTGAVLAALAVALGAFAAHGLKGWLDPVALDTFRTAAYYQMIHAIALILAGLLARQQNDARRLTASIFFLTGVVLFCGSLYALTLTGLKFLGIVTPFGGVAFILGWLALVRQVR